MALSSDEVLRAPIGAGLLDRLEELHRSNEYPDRPCPDSDPEAVVRAAEDVRVMPIGELLRLALIAAHVLVGPWNARAPKTLALLYRLASERVGIAQAVAERLNNDTDQEMNLQSQELWLSNSNSAYYRAAFQDLSKVYANGEFTWGGVWTVSAPPSQVYGELIAAWELHPGPISRWRLPISRDVSIWTIDSVMDWVRLVETYPSESRNAYVGWELALLNTEVQVTRTESTDWTEEDNPKVSTRHLLPDWEAVAADYHGVHLTWRGFLTSEGRLSSLHNGDTTMLRYWRSERTLWLKPVFEAPLPLDAPTVSQTRDVASGLSTPEDAVGAVDDTARRSQDLERLSRYLADN